MEKLLLNGDIVSRRIYVGKTVKSFPAKIVLMALLTLFCMMLPQKGWAAFTYESEEWDFEAAAQTDGAEIKMSSTIYSAIGSPAAYGETMTYGGTTKDISRFAFRYVQNNSGWWLRSNDGTNGLFGQEANNRYLQFAICNLHAGDIVTITYASNSATPISYVSGAHVYKTGLTGQVTNIESGVDHTVKGLEQHSRGLSTTQLFNFGSIRV